MKPYRIKVCGWNKIVVKTEGKRFDKGRHTPIVNFYEYTLRKAKEYLNEALNNNYEYTIEVFERFSEGQEKRIRFFDSTKRLKN